MDTQISKRLEVLVTGGSGAVGRPVCRALLAAGHQVRNLDLRPNPQVADNVVASITDAAAVSAAVAGMDAVVHLAAQPDEADFLTRLLPSNIIGLYHVCDAVRRHGVPRLILASTMQVITGLPWHEQLIGVAHGTRPHNHYGATKVFAEALGQVYAHRHKLAVVAARLGWLPRSQAESDDHAARAYVPTIFLSHDDAGRFFLAAVQADLPPGSFHPVFVTSRSPGRIALDPAPARAAVGYEAQDIYPAGLRFDEPDGSSR